MAFFDNVFTDGDITKVSEGIFSYIAGTSKKTKATPKKALTLSAFYNAVDIISNDVAKLPKSVYLKNETSREVFSESPINYLIATSPNDLMTAFDFWKVIVVLVTIKGNAFVKINRNKNTAEVDSLILLDEVKIIQKNDKLFYQTKDKTYHGSDVLHFKAFSLDGITGVSVVRFAAESLGVNLDAQDYLSSIYQDRGISYGVIESDLAVTVKDKKTIEKGFSDKMASGNKFRVPMLDQGLKYKSIVVTPKEAEFIETNKMAILEICRWLNIAPHKLKVLDNANFSNIYHQSIEHVQDSILPWLVRLEQEMNRKFFGKENPNFYVKMNEKMLLRGDLNSKQGYYSAMVYSGVMTRNEVRALEDLNPIDGLDEPLTPVNSELLDYMLKKNKKDLENEE